MAAAMAIKPLATPAIAATSTTSMSRLRDDGEVNSYNDFMLNIHAVTNADQHYGHMQAAYDCNQPAYDHSTIVRQVA